MFSQVLKVIPRTEFHQLVRKTGAEKAAEWSQFVAVLFCQLIFFRHFSGKLARNSV
jgi:hypothetical protein